MLHTPTLQPLLLAALLSLPRAVMSDGAFPYKPSGFLGPPQSGNAGATQFSLGGEFAGGTSCGVQGVQGMSATGGPGAGPGLLYAAINELGFGSHKNAGPACGLCYELTPNNAQGAPQRERAMTFMIVDLCPAVHDGQTQPACNVCSPGQTNSFGQQWGFDIGADAMNLAQYRLFFGGEPGDPAHNNVQSLSFVKKPCDGGLNPIPDKLSALQGPDNPGGACVKTDGSCAAGDSSSICASAANRLRAMARKREIRYQSY